MQSWWLFCEFFVHDHVARTLSYAFMPNGAHKNPQSHGVVGPEAPPSWRGPLHYTSLERRPLGVPQATNLYLPMHVGPAHGACTAYAGPNKAWGIAKTRSVLARLQVWSQTRPAAQGTTKNKLVTIPRYGKPTIAAQADTHTLARCVSCGSIQHWASLLSDCSGATLLTFPCSCGSVGRA